MIKPETAIYVKQQNENRLLWEGSDTERHLLDMIVQEKSEFDQQLQESYITDDLTALVAEVGDVLYICARYRMKYGDLPARAKAIEWEIIEACDNLGIDQDEAVMLKLDRNSKKYPDHSMSNGRSYEEAALLCKIAWKAQGGDVAWSHQYLEYFAHISE